MKTKVTIVIPNWNGAEMLMSCLEALSRQTLAPEIIVVDNGSEDNSVEMLKKHFPKVHLIKNFENRGFAGGVNPGIKHALGLQADYVVVLNNDTEPSPGWLAELVKEAEVDKHCGIVASKVIKQNSDQIDNTGENFSIWGFPFPRSRDHKVSSPEPDPVVFGASGGSTLYRTRMLRQVGLFDEDFFAYYEDADINWRAQLAGFTARYAQAAVVYHKIGGTSGRISGFTTYQTLKNLPWVIIKNVPLALLFKVLPRFLILYTLVLLKALFSRHFFFAIKALLVSLAFVPKKLWQRQQIQRNKLVSASYLGSLLYPGLPPNSRFKRVFRR